MATQSDICIIADERQRYRNGSNCKKKKNAQSKRVRFADDILAATRLDTMVRNDKKIPVLLKFALSV